jgi:DNA replication and repair protein RecF
VALAAPVPEIQNHYHGGLVAVGLQAFRNYDLKRFECAARQIVLIGSNGVGKTNILEGISLLAPGRGLRGASPLEWRRLGDSQAWRVACLTEDGTKIVTGAAGDRADSPRRFVSLNDATLIARAELSEVMAVVWLTPQMDGLFLGEASERRKFIDRLVAAAHPAHAAHLARYEHALKQRNKLLKERASDALIRSLHPILVSEGVAIAAARVEKTEQLNAAFATMETPFPLPHLAWKGWVENAIREKSARVVEEEFAALLENSLVEDRLIGQTRKGVHRADVEVTHTAKNMPASQCSTGEQKALLLSLVLAHAQWLKSVSPDRPLVLLLDEVAAHLDENRRAQLFAWVENIPAQVWFTGTDKALFAPMSNALVLNLPF